MKYTIEEISNIFELQDCILKSDYYGGSESYLSFQCSCGNLDKRKLRHFIKYPRCKQCQLIIRAKNRTMPYKKVKESFNNNGCILLTEEENYHNTQDIVDYVCSCGNKSRIKVNSFFNGRRCRKCGIQRVAQKNRIDYETIKEYIQSIEDCILITTKEEYLNTKTQLEIQCACGCIFYTNFTNVKHENKCRCNKCSFELNSGENARLWNGGVSTERDIVTHSQEYKNWRLKVFQRDNYTCQCCGDNSGGNLEAHHKLNYSEYPELRTDIENGITLCNSCHDFAKYGSFHHQYGSKNNTPEQLVEYIKRYHNGEFDEIKKLNLKAM